MADVKQKSRRRKRPAEEDESSADAATSKTSEERPSDEPVELAERVSETTPAGTGEATSAVREGGGTLVSELRVTVRDAALEVLRPVAREAAKSAAKTAATKAPELVKDRVMPKIADAGGPGAIAQGVLSKGGDVVGAATSKLGRKSKGPSGTGRGRRLPVQEHVDVGVDLQTAYDQWTQFEEFPRFMHRVEKVEQLDDATLMWHENIWGIRRSWKAEITEQRPCERIVWRSTNGPKQAGVVTFHPLSERLTRIQVNLDFQPQGLFEKTASGMRVSRRALRSDLMRFKAYLEMRDEATGAWRGLIEEGEVVEQPGREEAEEPEAEEEREEPEAEEEREEPEAEEEHEEPEAEEEQEEPEAEEEQEEPEEKPVRRRRVRRTASTTGRRRG
jgi:uncharacterized membrane protein